MINLCELCLQKAVLELGGIIVIQVLIMNAAVVMLQHVGYSDPQGFPFFIARIARAHRMGGDRN